jgi:hypothetical protein
MSNDVRVGDWLQNGLPGLYEWAMHFHNARALELLGEVR